MIVIAACNASLADMVGADPVYDGRSDVAVLAKVLAEPDREVMLTIGGFEKKAGFNTAGTCNLRSAQAVTIWNAFIPRTALLLRPG